MKIGIYGGSFNPIHEGHIFVVNYVINALKLDKVLIIPVGIPSHRENNLLDGEKRLEMCKLAFSNDNNIQVLDIEINSKKENYTYDTLMELKNIYKNDELFEIIGEDSGENFFKWKNYQEILDNSKVVILRRKGYKNSLNHKNVIFLESPYIEVSSTELRKKIKNNEDVSGELPKSVLEYIKHNKLYKN
ncbi:nicotinate (nicotinamide) nucleotide adenylyltransferase [Cetobacterium sp. SF1]|uniref:nicotinate (nicotinamide) nucleotide adenylyltransferase n=1 Tax=unclassified Cetobacterium TaxID=2630983 RepID=UPI003CF18584